MTTDTTVDTVFAMPSLGADMTEGRITEWLVQPGDTFERGQIVVIVETEKSDIEVEVFEAGTVAELLVPEGEMVPVGTPIARFQPRSTQQTVEPVLQVAEQKGLMSPVLRHLAEELHVDAEHVHGTGPGGRIQRDDIVAAAAPLVAAPVTTAPEVTPVEGRARVTPRARRLIHERGLDVTAFEGRSVVTGDDVLAMPTESAPARKLSRTDTMRRHIAELMTRSWTEIPHYHVTKRLDLSTAVDHLTAANEDRSVAERIVPGVLLMCATARAAAKVPGCNGWWIADTFLPADDVKLGVVLSLRTGGILVPTIDRPDDLTPAEMMMRLGELVQRARQGRLRSSDMAEASITVTNLGDRGADSVAGVIHPPQVAILGFGAVHDEVWPIDGRVEIRPTVHASLAGDHRATDGLTGSRYLTQIQNLLNGPLLEEL
jgi:pyruvate dehydrogenase E2 component (dihydrolipoamide acetyltransferase)